MKLPNGDRAVVEIKKLRDYCLDPKHPRGQHKARVFASAIGLSQHDAAQLQSALLAAAVSNNAVQGQQDAYGSRYMIDFVMKGPKGEATVRSRWIVREGEDFPRFTTCYVL
jgi:hypothetical protein